MESSVFIERVRAKNFKSIARCDVQLGALTYLVGPNGTGKSNFLDILHFVKDALEGSLENALQTRGGLSEVRRRSGGHPTNFGVDLSFVLPNKRRGRYSFEISAKTSGGFEVKRERCTVDEPGRGPRFDVRQGRVESHTEPVFPPLTSDRLALVNAAGLPAFRPVYDALVGMGFYNLNPRVIRDLQKPQDGSALKPLGENTASVLAAMERYAPGDKRLVEEYLQGVVPSVHGVKREGIGHMETLEFRQDASGANLPWRFNANSMSDGTLRALGILIALFQGGTDRPKLIGIEEPEVALHPAAAGVIRDAIGRASERSQVLVTSHSPELLNDASVTVDKLLAVTRRSGATAIAPLDAATRDVLREGLFTAGELLVMNQLTPEPESVDSAESKQLDLFGND
jgi:predicted ATPase